MYLGSALGILVPDLSDKTVETVSDLHLFSHSSLISKRPLMSRVLYSFLHKSVTYSLIFKAFSSSLEQIVSPVAVW